jgi:hypothetical protein
MRTSVGESTNGGDAEERDSLSATTSDPSFFPFQNLQFVASGPAQRP